MSFFPKLFGPARSSTARTPWTADTIEVPEGAGEPVGYARIDFRGEGTATVTVRVNGGEEQTVTQQLPFMLDYPVYPRVSTEASADAGLTELTGSITMNGMILSYENGPRPRVSYSHWD
ncbi:hypothetical protein [Gordonia sp. VNK21]|uniref:hypothetical protein n=1 Tax=Gordonia sp. VNK21 TaxID=3382483 RepID=UPI0038D516E4